MGWELYDLEKDPNELNNIYSSTEKQELIQDLKMVLNNLKSIYKVTQ